MKATLRKSDYRQKIPVKSENTLSHREKIADFDYTAKDFHFKLTDIFGELAPESD